MAGVIGDPVTHSLSPALHNAAFAALGLDWVYVAFPVAAGQGLAAVAAMRTLDLAGLSVTMPHKSDVVRGLDRLAPTAAQLGVVNTVSWATRRRAPSWRVTARTELDSSMPCAATTVSNRPGAGA